MNQKVFSEQAEAKVEKARAEYRAVIKARYDQLPPCNPPVRENTLMTLPLHDFRLDIETHRGLMWTFNKYAAEFTMCGNSDIGDARNKIFNAALASPFEWIVCIDSDIGFTPDDMEKLLYLEHARDYAVNGVYAKKNDKDQAVTQGLGFARIHRSVLEAIKLHLPFRYQSENANGDMVEHQDFCITGATEKMGMLREDTGFWFLCSQVGVVPRMEYTLNLRHYGGRRAYELSSLHRL